MLSDDTEFAGTEQTRTKGGKHPKLPCVRTTSIFAEFRSSCGDVKKYRTTPGCGDTDVKLGRAHGGLDERCTNATTIISI